MLLIINSWFIERRGFAYGLCYALGDLAGVVISFLTNFLLNKFGTKVTFLTFASLVGAVSTPCLLLLRERGFSGPLQRLPASPSPSSTGTEASKSIKYFRQRLFYILSLSSFLSGIGFYIPQNYLSTYAVDVLALPDYASPLLLAIQNFTAIISQPLLGFLSDTSSLHLLIIGTTSLCAVSTLLLWGLADLIAATNARLAILSTHALIFDIGGQSFLSLWPRVRTVLWKISFAHNVG